MKLSVTDGVVVPVRTIPGRKTMVSIVLALLATCCLPVAGFAEATKVEMGCYVDSLRNFDYLGGVFRADLYLWAKSPSNAQEPLDNMDFVRARPTWNSPTVKLDTNGTHYECRRYMVEAIHDWDIANFPFDTQRLRVSVEDLERSTTEMNFVADPESGFANKLIPADWEVKSKKIYVTAGQYRTNFGEPNDGHESSQYSRFIVEVILARHALPLFFKMVAGAYAAFLAICLSFWMTTEVPAYVSARIGLIVGCLFGTIINQRVVEAVVGRSSYVTHIDAIHIVTLVACIVAGLVTLISASLSTRQRPDAARRVDRIAFATLLLVYVCFNAALVGYDCWRISSIPAA